MFVDADFELSAKEGSCAKTSHVQDFALQQAWGVDFFPRIALTQELAYA
jgi:hypothetical protein